LTWEAPAAQEGEPGSVESGPFAAYWRARHAAVRRCGRRPRAGAAARHHSALEKTHRVTDARGYMIRQSRTSKVAAPRRTPVTVGAFGYSHGRARTVRPRRLMALTGHRRGLAAAQDARVRASTNSPVVWRPRSHGAPVARPLVGWHALPRATATLDLFLRASHLTV